MKTTWKNIPLWQKILAALILGLMTGIIFGESAQVLKPIGTLFINLIKMLIMPLVFVTLVTGIISMDDLKKMKRIGLKTFFIYLITTAIAITIGLIVGFILEPGLGVSLETNNIITVKESPSLIDTLLNIVTKNPFQSFSEGNVLQVIFFAIMLGISINLSGEKAEPAKQFFTSISEAMYKMTELVMSYAPFGVYGLMTWVSASYGVDVLLSLGQVILGVYIASIIHMIITFAGGISLIGKLNPIRFFKGIIETQTVGFTSTSSSGTLPITIQNTTKNLGISKPIASFVLPLGATINMDGTALYQGVCVMFIAQAFGITLSFDQYIMIILTSTLASIGTAGVPGAGLIMLTLVLTSVGLPIEGVALIAGIDRILDMARTTVNVTGDAMTSLLIAKSENEFNENIYNGTEEYKVVV